MRLRKKAWARPELESSKFFLTDPETRKDKWHEEFKNDNPIYLELGCGKGNFVSVKGAENKDINYVAIDIKDEVLVLAKRQIEKEFEKVNRKPEENVRLMAKQIAFIEEVFGKDEVDRIYINFCNPWPKKKHNKRRLTHTNFLSKYKTFLKLNGEIWFKTDDDELFRDSQEYLTQKGFDIKYITYDLHESNFTGNVETEHERMFTEMGIKIKCLIAQYNR
ncbi:tRNA (guanosine(46)-N7)-methyltransferase TrmB [Inconstantimicrobium porci]|uniref:tRNA (guanine-N(7)-)-methyltransferase n=1 Tax=Inconstantimicrobium porci TaxID=2652291 RepID=A0A7X2T066_9CLOT|nr:tRNA (guanosine(46)-N7)-methyltransferase TrmB [Inconstantimicrobium porci]MSR90256.1 tRNA (guanosine(46)-N7)-methyltransferase TrmB [Inconstantimicrobium porci]